MPEEPLSIFFAVTTTSLYRITWTPSNHLPRVQKIDMVGKSETPIGFMLTGGYYVGILKDCLVLYGTERLLPELVHPDHWGCTTSAIVGLFLREDKARACLASEELTPQNPRWREETEETLAAIGNDHPKFVISEVYGFNYD